MRKNPVAVIAPGAIADPAVFNELVFDSLLTIGFCLGFRVSLSLSLCVSLSFGFRVSFCLSFGISLSLGFLPL
jgi:hypothetical protein